jgi:hypothetical protein
VGVAQAFVIGWNFFSVANFGTTPTPALPTRGREKEGGYK